MGPFSVGQIPLESETIVVNDTNGEPRDLIRYISASMLMLDPSGAPILPSSIGTFRPVDPQNSSQLIFDWNRAASVFTTPGRYRYQVQLNGADGSKDYTTINSFSV